MLDFSVPKIDNRHSHYKIEHVSYTDKRKYVTVKLITK